MGPKTVEGNMSRDDIILKVGRPDTCDNLQLKDYEGLGGKTKIGTLPDPFKMVEKELKPFAESISELVSNDQPVLNMAAKHFFEKLQGKRFRPTIVQLMARAVAGVLPEDSLGPKVNGGWAWSGASHIDLEGGVVTPKKPQGFRCMEKASAIRSSCINDSC